MEILRFHQGRSDASVAFKAYCLAGVPVSCVTVANLLVQVIISGTIRYAEEMLGYSTSIPRGTKGCSKPSLFY
ncbi:hypothetical protein BDM02DRAFT_3109813 [Thelephora ganbajun]|uniref:Uncharacterized protein n=1 Tax=Thelephora ganbajun TaxID=370292 RepID=A0ACB6ZQC3_THEGA|nr:hypothetical protein BDM02DRAFT_3109813 [Thelephora ganbajun]